MPRGCRQACCVKRLLRSPTPKPTSPPTLCSVWEKWEMILLPPGRAKLNGSRIWIESTECPRSSSGKYSQESQRWASSRRFKVWWETHSVNLISSKTRSFSCQCTTTLNGKQKETKKDVNTIHRQLRINLANSLAVIGLSWGLDQKRSGAEPAPTQPTDPGIEWQKKWCWISMDPSSNISCLWERGELRTNGGSKKSIHCSGSHENIELLSPHNDSSNQLSIYGAIADLCSEVPKDLGAPGKLAAPDHLEKMEIPADLSLARNYTNAQQWWNLVQEYERKFEQLS